MTTNLLLFVIVLLVACGVLMYHNMRHELERAQEPDPFDDSNDDDPFFEDQIYTWLSEEAKDAPPIDVRSRRAGKRRKRANWN